MGDRNSLLTANDAGTVPVDVPEWGGTFHLRHLTVADRQKVLAKATTEDKANLPVWLLVYSLCDPGGRRLFDEDDYAALSSKSAVVLDRVAVEAGKLNGLYAGAVDEAGKA